MPSNNGFSVLDWAVVAGYFAMVFAVAFAYRIRDRNDAAENYFLAGKNVGWFIIGASVFASNIGSEHLVGLAGQGAASGLPGAQYEILAALALMLLGWLFVPFYLSSGVFTMPEFLEKRYSAGPRYYLALISIVGYVLTKISVTIAAGGIVFQNLMGIDFWTGALVVVAATGVYTLWGGLRAVLITDMVQMFVLIGGAVAVTAVGLHHIGGWGALREAVEPERFSLWRPSSDPDYPWTGILFGAPILAIWYWCTDQFIVQRTLSARSISEARRGVLFAGFLKQLPLFIFVLPGVVAYALMKQGALDLPAPDAALPKLIQTLLPAGLKGLVAAGLLAALMSSLSSVFNSCATILTIDVYQKFDPHASDRRLVTVGRAGVALMTVFGLLWIPYIKVISGQLFLYIQSVQAYISPPIAAVFLVGVLWPRGTSAGAMATLAVGFFLGIGRLVLDIAEPHLSGPLLALAQVNFLHIALALFLICTATHVLVSLATSTPAKTSHALALTTARAGAREAVRKGRRMDIALTVVLLLTIVAVWAYFSPLSQ